MCWRGMVSVEKLLNLISLQIAGEIMSNWIFTKLDHSGELVLSEAHKEMFDVWIKLFLQIWNLWIIPCKKRLETCVLFANLSERPFSDCLVGLQGVQLVSLVIFYSNCKYLLNYACFFPLSDNTGFSVCNWSLGHHRNKFGVERG